MDINAADFIVLPAREVAKLVRTALKEKFPGTKFSVRTRQYSLGASIGVAWTDGPPRARVLEVTDEFAGCDYDGLTDSKIRRRPKRIDGYDLPVIFGSDFILCHRSRTTKHELHHLR